MKLNKKNILPLISASAAAGNEKKLRELILLAKKDKIRFIKLYEVLLQNYLFAGFPSALISLNILREFYPHKKLSFRKNDRTHYGEDLCRKIYGNQYEKLIKNISDFSPELSVWLIEEGYGKVLTRKGLSIKERERAVIAVLSVLGFKSQLFSHINGAVNVGVKIPEINSTINSLDILGKKSYKKFGEKVLKDFIKRKRVNKSP